MRKLKPGPGLAPAVVFADQRRRLREAMIELAVDHGLERVTVRALTKQAGVSTRTFYRHFDNVDDCLGNTCESTMLEAVRQMEEAQAAAEDWEAGLRTAVTSLMSNFASQPDAATVALVEVFAGGPSALDRMKTMTRTLEQLLAEQLSESSVPVATKRYLACGMVAGALRVATTTIMAGRANELPGLSPHISQWMLSLTLLQGEQASGPFALSLSGSRRRREPVPFPDKGASDAVSIGDERERIFRACLRLAAAAGLSALTIPRIRSAAEVSRRSFDSYFVNLNECFLDSIEWLVGSAGARAQSWVEGGADPDRRTQRLVLALCAQVARNDALANLVFAGMLEAGRAGFLRRERLVTIGATKIREHLELLPTAGNLFLEASAAAAWELAYVEVTAGKAQRLPGLSPLIAHLILAPARSFEPAPSN